ncbi:hypothetical protein FQA39_LY04831 [Lamprigera yunnana]|nr:hypothetical protein FQA39_LY04831 [Lamprigera yunnana]
MCFMLVEVTAVHEDQCKIADKGRQHVKTLLFFNETKSSVSAQNVEALLRSALPGKLDDFEETPNESDRAQSLQKWFSNIKRILVWMHLE